MSKGYYTYRIRIANRDRVQVEKRKPQNVLDGEPKGAFGYKDELRQQIDALNQAAQGEQLGKVEVKELGEALFNALFDPVLRQDFVNYYNQVIHVEKQLLRIELDIDEQSLPEIAALPWEFMRVPTDANLGTLWLGTAPNLIFSRRRTQWHAAQPIQLEHDEKLRIALAVAAPTEGYLDVEKQVLAKDKPVAFETVWETLQKLADEQANRIELLPIVNPANPETIDEILIKEPHIFHFIGHGRLHDAHGKEVGQIALVDDFDKAMWNDAEEFSELFVRHHPDVVLLQTCESGALSDSQAFVGVASRIVQQNISVVAAMQYPVSNSTASRFAQRFYQQLAQDDPVDLAAQDGRHSIALGPTRHRTRDFATPVLFMRVEDGHLFARKPHVVDVAKPSGVERPRQLLKALSRLNYEPQRSQFNLIRMKTNRMGAFLISGPNKLVGQRWLLNRLVESLLDNRSEDPKVVRVDLKEASVAKDVRFLWDELARTTSLEVGAPEETIITTTYQVWQKKDILFIFNNVNEHYASYLPSIITDFWNPLVTKVQELTEKAQKQTQAPEQSAHDHWFLMFIVDNDGHLVGRDLMDLGLDITELSLPTWKPTHPIQLRDLDEFFEQGQVLDWLVVHRDISVLSSLQEQINTATKSRALLDDIWELSYQGIPELTLRTLCGMCDLQWCEMTKQWVKL